MISTSVDYYPSLQGSIISSTTLNKGSSSSLMDGSPTSLVEMCWSSWSTFWIGWVGIEVGVWFCWEGEDNDVNVAPTHWEAIVEGVGSLTEGWTCWTIWGWEGVCWSMESWEGVDFPIDGWAGNGTTFVVVEGFCWSKGNWSTCVFRDGYKTRKN